LTSKSKSANLALLAGLDTVAHSRFPYSTGDVTTFPPSATLVVGPGFKEQLLPGYPINPDSPVLEADWVNRELREIIFDQRLQIGPFKAFDFFGDGSLYLLDTPGHAIGHMAALARTEKESFVFLGGDCAHHCGVFRPTPYLPMPETVSDPRHPEVTRRGSDFINIHPYHSPVSPFYEPATHIAADIQQNLRDIKGMQIFDADPNVLTMLAHDSSFLELFEGHFFPQKINNWKELGMKEKAMWRFLKDFKVAGE
jgi:glyoxylase-like metal-dependent hydrolase (beta-lactamase superfamily II)